MRLELHLEQREEGGVAGEGRPVLRREVRAHGGVCSGADDSRFSPGTGVWEGMMGNRFAKGL